MPHLNCHPEVSFSGILGNKWETFGRHTGVWVESAVKCSRLMGSASLADGMASGAQTKG